MKNNDFWRCPHMIGTPGTRCPECEGDIEIITHNYDELMKMPGEVATDKEIRGAIRKSLTDDELDDIDAPPVW